MKQNQQFLATGQGGGPSDGSNAVLLAAFSENPIDSLGGINLDGYYEKIVANVTQSSASEAAAFRRSGWPLEILSWDSENNIPA